MTNATRSVGHLQTALAMEMTAIHQYLLHAHVLDDMGLDILADRMREEMGEELGHAGRFIDRILFLDGDPKIVASRAPRRAGQLRDMFAADRDDEAAAIEFYAEAAKAADEDRDIGTRMLFERIIVDEEGHLDWLSRQIDLLERMGEPGYMARNMRARSNGA